MSENWKTTLVDEKRWRHQVIRHLFSVEGECAIDSIWKVLADQKMKVSSQDLYLFLEQLIHLKFVSEFDGNYAWIQGMFVEVAYTWTDEQWESFGYKPDLSAVKTPTDAPAMTLPAELTELAPSSSEATSLEPTPDESPRDVIHQLERLDLGFELAPYSPDGTAVKVRECHRKMLRNFLEMGAYLSRARAAMGAAAFWKWYEEQEFPIGYKWAKEAMHTMDRVRQNPELKKLAEKMTSTKHFQVVARQLQLPYGREEFSTSGTVLGKSVEELERLSRRQLEELEKAKAEAQKHADVMELQVMELKVSSDLINSENAALRRKLVEIQNPDLASQELEGDFKKDMLHAFAAIHTALWPLRPMGRRDLDTLTPETILTFYAQALTVEREVLVVLREIETRWGGHLPELLQGADGQPRGPLDRAQLRLLVQQTQESQQAVGAAVLGKPLTIIDQDGVVLH